MIPALMTLLNGMHLPRIHAISSPDFRRCADCSSRRVSVRAGHCIVCVPAIRSPRGSSGRMQLVVVEVDVARHQAEAECEAWPVGGVLAGRGFVPGRAAAVPDRSEEHTSELQSLMRISYAVFCLKKKKKH